jgi:hypothetical protein
MTKFKIIILLTLILALNSCKNRSLTSDTETYKIEIKKVSNFHRVFTNHIQKTPLNINAERISLKNIFGILIKTDTSNIKFENKKMKNEYYNLLIEQKNKNHSINEAVLNDILINWNLNLITDKYKSYNLKIQDTIRYSNLTSNSNDMVSKVFISKDSIKINNCDLKKLTEILNSEFSERIIYNDESNRIDYNWKRTTFGKLKLQLKNDLGILFLDTKKDKSVFTIRSN